MILLLNIVNGKLQFGLFFWSLIRFLYLLRVEMSGLAKPVPIFDDNHGFLPSSLLIFKVIKQFCCFLLKIHGTLTYFFATTFF